MGLEYKELLLFTLYPSETFEIVSDVQMNGQVLFYNTILANKKRK